MLCQLAPDRDFSRELTTPSWVTEFGFWRRPARRETSVAAVADRQQTRPDRCVRANRPAETNTDANSNPDANDERPARQGAPATASDLASRERRLARVGSRGSVQGQRGQQWQPAGRACGDAPTGRRVPGTTRNGGVPCHPFASWTVEHIGTRPRGAHRSNSCPPYNLTGRSKVT